jgi:hypothetical protein
MIQESANVDAGAANLEARFMRDLAACGLPALWSIRMATLASNNLTHNRAFTIGREVTPKAVEQMEGSKRHGNNYSRP